MIISCQSFLTIAPHFTIQFIALLWQCNVVGFLFFFYMEHNVQSLLCHCLQSAIQFFILIGQSMMIEWFSPVGDFVVFVGDSPPPSHDPSHPIPIEKSIVAFLFQCDWYFLNTHRFFHHQPHHHAMQQQEFVELASTTSVLRSHDAISI